ncbi:unnamed protein product [Amoebophrya sp. A120]|nr:unnamed protein product [Amoebophrya sp. A120]|eukprot:GSA120T00023012001.1
MPDDLDDLDAWISTSYVVAKPRPPNAGAHNNAASSNQTSSSTRQKNKVVSNTTTSCTSSRTQLGSCAPQSQGGATSSLPTRERDDKTSKNTQPGRASGKIMKKCRGGDGEGARADLPALAARQGSPLVLEEEKCSSRYFSAVDGVKRGSALANGELLRPRKGSTRSFGNIPPEDASTGLINKRLRSLVVRDLPSSATEKSVRRYIFPGRDEVVERCVVLTDADGFCRGTAYVYFPDHDSAAKALDAYHEQSQMLSSTALCSNHSQEGKVQQNLRSFPRPREQHEPEKTADDCPPALLLPHAQASRIFSNCSADALKAWTGAEDDHDELKSVAGSRSRRWEQADVNMNMVVPAVKWNTRQPESGAVQRIRRREQLKLKKQKEKEEKELLKISKGTARPKVTDKRNKKRRRLVGDLVQKSDFSHRARFTRVFKSPAGAVASRGGTMRLPFPAPVVPELERTLHIGDLVHVRTAVLEELVSEQHQDDGTSTTNENCNMGVLDRRKERIQCLIRKKLLGGKGLQWESDRWRNPTLQRPPGDTTHPEERARCSASPGSTSDLCVDTKKHENATSHPPLALAPEGLPAATNDHEPGSPFPVDEEERYACAQILDCLLSSKWKKFTRDAETFRETNERKRSTQMISAHAMNRLGPRSRHKNKKKTSKCTPAYVLHCDKEKDCVKIGFVRPRNDSKEDLTPIEHRNVLRVALLPYFSQDIVRADQG